MSKAEKISNFNPNNPGDPDSNIFGLPFTCEESEIVIVPVPWDVTVSYSDGTSGGPDAIMNASFQVDLFEPSIQDAWKIGIAMEDISAEVVSKNKLLREKAKVYIDAFTQGVDHYQDQSKNKIRNAVKWIRSELWQAGDHSTANIRDEVNQGSLWLNAWVKQRCLHWINQGKLVALLGGDHSTPLGFMQALAEKYSTFGILQIDAHADLRNAYEGFTYSHASIMYNALGISQVSKLVQVGIRDYCEEEVNVMREQKDRVVTFFDRDLKHEQYNGKTWAQQAEHIVSQLPENVYISFDIDGLDQKLCPNTGTPVAGGFEFEQAAYLIQAVVKSGKKIIGLDLNEVAPGEHDEWDANVGARMLLRMCNSMALSNHRI
jgi:agmatinase